MKKLIRLFLIIFCLLFVLLSMPGSFLPALRRLIRRSGRLAGEATLQIAEFIDDFSGEGTETPSGAVTDSLSPDRGGSGSGGDGLTDGGIEGNREGKEAGSTEPGQAQKSSPGAKESEEEKAEENDKDSGKKSADQAADTAPDAGGRAGKDGDKEGEDTLKKDAENQETPEEDVFYYYYTKISKEERLLYDAMLALAMDPEDGSGSEESRLLDTNPSSDAFAESYTRAYNALVSDHPELFWIAQGRARYECRYYVLPSFGGKYKVFLSLTDGAGGSAGAGSPDQGHAGESRGDGTDFRSQYRREQEELEAAADALLDQVDLTQSDAMIALALHDLLIDSAWYNTEAGTDDYAHTAYGALVEDSSGNPGGALCDGYALAYEYLLQRAGLTSTMVCGYAGASEEDNEKHAWNLVLLDDEWYEVDATWDDLDFLISPSDNGYDLLLEALSDEEYMAGIRHYMFNRTTEQMRSFTPGDEYTYVSYSGWVTLLQPSVHIRFTSDESEETRDYVTPLAPEAEGTWYTWDMLTGRD